MAKPIRFFLYGMLLLLTACGFHLKGMGGTQHQFPYPVWRVVNAGAMHDALVTEISRQNNARVAAEGDSDAAVLNVTGVNQSRDIQTFNRSGAVNEYLLVLSVHAQAQYRGQDLGAPMTVTVQRNFSYSDNELLGKQQEEADLWEDMRRDVAGQIIRRMSFLPKADEVKP